MIENLLTAGNFIFFRLKHQFCSLLDYRPGRPRHPPSPSADIPLVEGDYVVF